MYGSPTGNRPSGGRRWRSQQPPLQAQLGSIQNPNFAFQNPNYYLQEPNFLLHQHLLLQNQSFPFQNPGFPIQNPYFPTQNTSHSLPPQKLPHQRSDVPSSSKNRNELLEKVDCAVASARRRIIEAGESVTSWKVSQEALLTLKVDSWNSLGFAMQEVPNLHRLILTEGKINAFIHCFIGVRRITSLYDLQVEICKNEGVEQFEELELGPFLRQPLILHYFSVKSDVTEVHKITSEEIISFLWKFLRKIKHKKFVIEDFLDFIAKRRPVAGKEELGIRVQSLGMHISAIRKGMNLENGTIQKSLKKLKIDSDKKYSKSPHFSLQKKQLDERFSSISQRVESFSSIKKDFWGKHIRFASSSSDDETSIDFTSEDERIDNATGTHFNFPSQDVKSSDRTSSCPYPSEIEEMTRLGLKGEMHGHSHPANGSPCNEKNGSSKKKRKFENQSSTISATSGSSRKKRRSENFGCIMSGSSESCKRFMAELDVHAVDNSDETRIANDINGPDLVISDDSLRMFITTWKEACCELTASEVFERMLQYYDTNNRQRKKFRSMFSSLPFAGLLNIAVSSIKSGMWDSLYETFQALSQQKLTQTHMEKDSEYTIIDVEPSVQDVPGMAEDGLKGTRGVSVQEIMQKVSIYLLPDSEIKSNTKSVLERRMTLLRKLYNCEYWLAEQFSVKTFKSLGHGEFLMFLEEHASILPDEVYKFLIGDMYEKSPLEVQMAQHQLAVLVSQALNVLQENETMTKEMISLLLMRQFPLVSLKISENGSVKDLLDMVGKQKRNIVSKGVLFSATLFEMHYDGGALAYNENGLLETTKVRSDISHKTAPYKSITSRDAIEVLLRAPMMSDLNLWAHWNLIFAPSLGPLVPWLLSEVNMKELLCLVTRDGKVLRIDFSATVDSFLEAALLGSPFQTALQLLSLFSLLGGEKYVPLSLLKCHARHAFEVILKNSLESMDVTDVWKSPMLGNRRLKVADEGAACNFSSDLHISLCKTNKAVPVLSGFILDCLGFLPPEFRCFAADILLSSMRALIKDAASAIMCECNQAEERLMLHEVGLSLGIVEWIDDYHAFCSTDATDMVTSGSLCLKTVRPEKGIGPKNKHDALPKSSIPEVNIDEPVVADGCDEECTIVGQSADGLEVLDDRVICSSMQHLSEPDECKNATLVIESIRRDEFGLDPNLPSTESSMLKKQHARLGRALHCLSQELYSQDSHFLLELVQNADDNDYPANVEPTLTFILQELGIIVLNNERGFSAQNIRALCDVGNSTKKGSNAGYIGQKGIGFKSVFRVTDAPEIHSNGFHVKFDISEGQIGFVLPTIVPPCDIGLFSRLASSDNDQLDSKCWNTCIVLPFRLRLSDGAAMNSIPPMFSDLHPSLLLFLHRLKCIKFRNLLNNTFIVMRKEIMADGIVKVSHGKETMTWFVASQKLQADVIHRNVQTTEISIAFTLQESIEGDYIPLIDQQPVFAFLPLRTYGLKFILQGDFVLPSSREEVDGDSPWNQWLLSEFPNLFVGVERSFCALSCFRENPGKAVSAFMSFVPLVGEVHGFFSSLPRLIISKLRMSNCLLLDGGNDRWAPPCKVLRGWNEEARSLLPDAMLYEHLGLGFLDRNIKVSDSLARALGIQEYGATILVQFMASLSHVENGIKSMGLSWLSSWLNALYKMLFHSSGKFFLYSDTEMDLIMNLQKISFIPLSDGTYSSVDEGTIWLQSDVVSTGFDIEHGPEAFPNLVTKLRTVCPALLSASIFDTSIADMSLIDNITKMLHRIGVQRLSAHEIMKLHILPAVSDDRIINGDKNLMAEYLCFVMIHLKSSCADCRVEREYIISELRNKAFILTNHGFKRPVEVWIHFSQEYGNPVDVKKLINIVDAKWHEVDSIYLRHPVTESVLCGVMKWREFLQEIGITDFVQIIQVNKTVSEISPTILRSLMQERDLISPESIVKDWESHELVYLMSLLSKNGMRQSCIYLLEVFDLLWDGCFSDKATGYCNPKSGGEYKPFKSSFMGSICDVQWVASSMDDELHYPKDLFYDCDSVRSILGASAPYAVPKVKNGKLVGNIGFKTKVTIDDVWEILKVWKRSKTPFKASLSQMSKLYTFIWNEMATSKQKILEELHSGPFIFVPYASVSRLDDVVPGIFLSPEQVCWHDSTGSLDHMEKICSECTLTEVTHSLLNKMLSNIYPSLHDFFIDACGVPKTPPLCSYLQILLQLSTVALPSQAANAVFQVFLRWSDGLISGLLRPEDVTYLKECLMKLEFKVLPTEQDKWVSLHSSFGLVCWCDDKKLRKQFKNFDNIDFLHFGELSEDETQMLKIKVSVLMQTFGIPALSEVVIREAIYYGLADCSFKTSLLGWALPYAQRYLCSVHPDKYIQLKQSRFDILNCLQVIVVEELYYRNVIKGGGGASKKRIECSCLLQGNILYTTRESDSHAMYMELSRLLLDGTPDLHLANFLHMITTMAESGSTPEQIEFFILNSQKVPRLPDEESVWSFSSMPPSTKNDDSIQTRGDSKTVDEKSYSKSKNKAGSNSSWPPVGWKTAPGFSYARANGFKTQAITSQSSSSPQKEKDHNYEGRVTQSDDVFPISVDDDWTVGDDSTALVFSDYDNFENLSGHAHNRTDCGVDIEIDPVDLDIMSDGPKLGPSHFCKRDQLRTGTPNATQAAQTGRLGELVAFKYITEKVGKTVAKWVNEDSETGLPYDIVVGEESSQEYIEVKATKSRRKDWFNISTREWQFAVDKGDLFSIAHVVLLGNNVARVSLFKNPVKLCQLGKLQLVCMLPMQQTESSIAS